MPRYVCVGEVPPKRHIQFRKPNGQLFAEQVFGTKGFSGINSILYHANAPTNVKEYRALGDLRPEMAPDEPLRHHHLKTWPIAARGDAVNGRVPFMMNDDVTISLCRPVEAMSYFYKNADGDDLIFVHVGSGKLQTMFGSITYREGDYLVVPRGTIYRLLQDPGEQRMLIVEAAGAIETPRRYRNEYGQLLEHAPYYERDIRVPELPEFHDEPGEYEVRIKARGRLTAYYYDFHPMDVVGWDGYLYPWALNIADFEPITGSLHQPPPTHQTFEAHNFVVCSFVPRMLDYHPLAVPIPYNHSNLDSDEMLYYANDKFSSRKGIEKGSITLHPSGIPHGPQPGAVEASLGAKRTEELAVMVDTFRPLRFTKSALAFEDTDYPFSWKPRS